MVLVTKHYVHLCCLVERLVTRSPIENYADEQRFANEHNDFVEAFRTSFSDISAHYHVEVPVAEIAYALLILIFFTVFVYALDANSGKISTSKPFFLKIA